MKIREVALNEAVLAQLIALSEAWTAEDNCYGYRPNDRSDIVRKQNLPCGGGRRRRGLSVRQGF